MRRGIPAHLIAWLTASGLLACAPPEQVRYEQEVRESAPASLHAVYSERLRELMHDLERLQRERLPQALDTAGEARRRATDVARIAGALADSATHIAGALPPESLAPGERDAFVREAGVLEDRARELAREAPSLGAPALQARVAAIEATCDACHSRFRAPR